MGSSRPASRVAIATCTALPNGDEDAPLLAAALAARSVEAQWCVWTDPAVDWNRFDLTVIRSTWDYTGERTRFLRWAESTPRLHNPASILAWNSDKSYLRDLSDQLIPTVPTTWLEPGDPLVVPPGEYVLKPTVGAGSKGAGRFGSAETGGATEATEATSATSATSATRAREHLRSLHDAGRTVMVQPYLADVDTAGEAALVYLGGQFSHAITKSAMLGRDEVNALEAGYSRSLYVAERIRPRRASAAERALGAQVIAAIRDRFGELVYARVDLLPTPEGPVVIEVELTEPSLFLSHDRASADRLAAALTARLTTR